MTLAAFVAFAQTDIKVQVHNVVAADEQFNVTFIIEGEGKITDFQWQPGSDFQLLWGPQQGRSTSMQIINGKTTSRCRPHIPMCSVRPPRVSSRFLVQARM